jgi:hypothetical protein
MDVAPRVPSRGRKGKKGGGSADITAAVTHLPGNYRRQRRMEKIANETRHYNRFGDKHSEFCLACWNSQSKITLSGSRSKIYELIAEADADHIGFLGVVEHKDIFADEPNGRVAALPKGWRWISVSAERGPSGLATVGGVGALISPIFSKPMCLIKSFRHVY